MFVLLAFAMYFVGEIGGKKMHVEGFGKGRFLKY
jgi:hypothetical protein